MIETLASELRENLSQIRELSRKDNPQADDLWRKIEQEMPELVKMMNERNENEKATCV